VSASGINWAICKSAPCPRQITMPASHHSFFTGQMPFLPPNQQHQSTEGKLLILLVFKTLSRNAADKLGLVYVYALFLDSELSSGHSPDATTTKSFVVCCFLLQYAMLVWYMPSFGVHLSITSQCSTKMAKHMIMQTLPHDRPGTQKSRRNSNGVTPNGDTKCRWDRLK